MKTTTIFSLIVAASLLAGCSTTAPTTESRIMTPADARRAHAARAAKLAPKQAPKEVEFFFHDARTIGRAGTPAGTRLQPGASSKPRLLLAD
jgi:hypothetical protein